MLTSMTGFGRGEVQGEGKQFNIELKSINHRYMDINIRLPRIFTYLEDNIRQVIKRYIKRGRIEVFINYKNLDGKDIQVTADIPLIQQYINALDEIHDTFKVEKNIDVTTIAKLPDVFKVDKKEEDEEKVWTFLEKALIIALEDLVKMRQIEGDKLREDLVKRIEIIADLMDKVEQKSPKVVLEYKERLKKRIKDIMDEGIDIDEEKIAMEVALFADKSNITEEIIRFNSHIIQFKSSIMEDDAIGRKLDFIIQEMNREVNTIGSKSNDLVISNLVVEIKSELEKIREQVQNIE